MSNLSKNDLLLLTACQNDSYLEPKGLTIGILNISILLMQELQNGHSNKQVYKHSTSPLKYTVMFTSLKSQIGHVNYRYKTIKFKVFSSFESGIVISGIAVERQTHGTHAHVFKATLLICDSRH